MKLERIIISGGGTGGHIFPALAIAEAFRKAAPGINILFIGAEGRMEMEKIPAAGYPIEAIRIEGLKRKNLLANIFLIPKLFKAIRQSKKIIRRFGAQLVVGTGGFVSGPVLWAACDLKIPAVIQEQNSLPGLTNRLLGRRVRLICTAYPGLERYFPGKRVVLTGNPVREKIEFIRPGKAEACQHFRLQPQWPVVLVYGGSQGARGINLGLQSALPALQNRHVQVLWQTGHQFFPEAERWIAEHNLTLVKPIPFIDEMQLAYAAADLVVSRAGAMTISELALLAKPVILIPLPTAAQNHQYHNARVLEEAGAACCLMEDEVPSRLSSLILELLNDTARRTQMATKISGFAKPRAAEAIVHAILQAL
ncbi:MAG: undecaprenyldiphospho-muramoylpentapeptide beta-N-acetylglucosaminyltransferase [Flavobacteriales bacterium]|nr:undecaprenyldiphospho-muramoylpentapeptide beta-N-acetylglucosaminyltransferase [Flavobacteriales bacterium]MCX7768357.1 undecaprenyldiphospho-muramoylpentapeptide beta-N-acetylglucosaminyltransferase [Flavobacteriales bacterium]MDW8409083.1 undecaprenyldiphospho-muramoylpentapeptide beta-N-acetylglucosaminyltransferase [Flavobacteriales bacterium]